MPDAPGGTPRVQVSVSVGIGMWKATAEVSLVACPHVGDRIVVNDVVVTCEWVTITAEKVYVEQAARFQSEDEAHAYFN